MCRQSQAQIDRAMETSRLGTSTGVSGQTDGAADGALSGVVDEGRDGID